MEQGGFSSDGNEITFCTIAMPVHLKVFWETMNAAASHAGTLALERESQSDCLG